MKNRKTNLELAMLLGFQAIKNLDTPNKVFTYKGQSISYSSAMDYLFCRGLNCTLKEIETLPNGEQKVRVLVRQKRGR